MLIRSCSCDIVGVHPDQRATKLDVERYRAGLTTSVTEVTLSANSFGWAVSRPLLDSSDIDKTCGIPRWPEQCCSARATGARGTLRTCRGTVQN
jgi:hypothetical protein